MSKLLPSQGQNERYGGGDDVPSGGARKGSGRKPKPLAEKLATGNPGRRELKKMVFDPNAEPPKAPAYLRHLEKEGLPREFPTTIELFDAIVQYLHPSNCLTLIPEGLITNYAMAKYYLMSAQYELSRTATVAYNDKKKEDLVITSFAKAMLELQKNELATWNAIWNIVRDNSDSMVVHPGDELIAMIMHGRVRKKRPKGDPPEDYYQQFVAGPIEPEEGGEAPPDEAAEIAET